MVDVDEKNETLPNVHKTDASIVLILPSFYGRINYPS